MPKWESNIYTGVLHESLKTLSLSHFPQSVFQWPNNIKMFLGGRLNQELFSCPLIVFFYSGFFFSASLPLFCVRFFFICSLNRLKITLYVQQIAMVKNCLLDLRFLIMEFHVLIDAVSNSTNHQYGWLLRFFEEVVFFDLVTGLAFQ